MNSKYIYICVSAFLLLTSCWSGKVSTSKSIDIEQKEIDVSKWQYSGNTSWRLAIDDSVAWRRKTIVRQYDSTNQVICETITEESLDRKVETTSDGDEDVEANAEDEKVVKIEKEEKTKTKIKGNNNVFLCVGIILVLVSVCLYKKMAGRS